MLTLYIYEPNTMTVVEIVTGGTQAEQEAYANGKYDRESFGWTYSPALGLADGLVEDAGAMHTELRNGWTVTQSFSVTGWDGTFLGKFTNYEAATNAGADYALKTGHVTREELGRS